MSFTLREQFNLWRALRKYDRAGRPRDDRFSWEKEPEKTAKPVKRPTAVKPKRRWWRDCWLSFEPKCESCEMWPDLEHCHDCDYFGGEHGPSCAKSLIKARTYGKPALGKTLSATPMFICKSCDRTRHEKPIGGKCDTCREEDQFMDICWCGWSSRRHKPAECRKWRYKRHDEKTARTGILRDPGNPHGLPTCPECRTFVAVNSLHRQHQPGCSEPVPQYPAKAEPRVYESVLPPVALIEPKEPPALIEFPEVLDDEKKEALLAAWRSRKVGPSIRSMTEAEILWEEARKIREVLQDEVAYLREVVDAGLVDGDYVIRNGAGQTISITRDEVTMTNASMR